MIGLGNRGDGSRDSFFNIISIKIIQKETKVN